MGVTQIEGTGEGGEEGSKEGEEREEPVEQTFTWKSDSRATTFGKFQVPAPRDLSTWSKLSKLKIFTVRIAWWGGDKNKQLPAPVEGGERVPFPLQCFADHLRRDTFHYGPDQRLQCS